MATEHTENPEDALTSKSEIKRQMSALQNLGESLVTLEEKKLSQLPLSDSLLEAVTTAKKIRKREGLRRQLQFIGKLMRKEPEETVEKIQMLLDKKNQSHQQTTIELHQAEKWREELITQGDNALQRFLSEHPHSDRQQLRQIIRAAQQEVSKQLPPKHQRRLFRVIRECIAADTTNE